MRRGSLLLIGITALAAIGCHKKQPANQDQPLFTGVNSAGPTGDAMSRFALQYGVPVYPGSVPDTAHFNAADSQQGNIYLAYSTTDNVDLVSKFYLGQLHVNAQMTGGVSQLVGTSQNGSIVTITLGHDMNGSRTDYTIRASSATSQNTSQLASNSVMGAPVGAAPETVPQAAPTNQATQDQQTYTFSTSNAPPDVDSNQAATSGDQGTDQGTSTDNSNDNNTNNTDNGGGQGNGNDQTTGGDNGNQSTTSDNGPPGLPG